MRVRECGAAVDSAREANRLQS